MKKVISVFLSLVMIFVFPCFVSADENAGTETEVFEDGSFLEIVTETENESELIGFFSRLINFLKRLVEFFTGQKTVTKTKYMNYYASDGVLLWSAKLKADFMYSKKEAVCTDSSFSMDIYDSDWVLISSDCRNAGDTAEAEFSVRQYKLAVPLKTVEKTITLTCDTQGNVK